MSIVHRTRSVPRRRKSEHLLCKAIVETLESRILLSTYTVTNLSDVASGSDGYVGSLRAAIDSANLAGGTNTISFGPTVSGIITLTQGELELSNGNITISYTSVDGSSLTINGNGDSRVFAVDSGVTATLQGMTITDGSVDDFDLDEGATRGRSELRRHDDLHGSDDQNGGGILNLGTLDVTDCTISGSAAAYGGGIYSSGTLDVSESTILYNTSYDGGAGIFDAGTATIVNSTITGNSSDNTGGGVYSYKDSNFNLINSTITGNSAGDGGGVYGYYGTQYITDCTIVGNSGGGVSTISHADINGSIVAENTDGGDLGGSFSGSYNLVGAAVSGLTTTNHNLVDESDPDLGTLGDYGGPTETMPLLPGSPAINAGHTFDDQDDDPITTDQRGMARPQGSGADAGDYDIGAFQTQPALVVNTTSDDPVGSGQLSLRDAINLANAMGGTTPINITFASGLSGTITLTQGELALTSGTITIDYTGSGGSTLTIDGNGESRVFSVEAGVTATLDNLTISGGVAQGSDIGGSETLRDRFASHGRFSDLDLDMDLEGLEGDAFGGGILNVSTLTLNNCTVSGNTAYNGGGIYSYGTLSVRDSTVSDNTTSYSGNGAGIFDWGTTTIANSTISGNSTPDQGGGIYDDQATTTLTNSTISGNIAGGSGAAIYDYSSTENLTDCTVSANTSGGSNSSVLGSGEMNGTIVSGNSGGDLQGHFTGNDNLIGTGGTHLTGSSNQTGVSSPLLAPLGNYGGPTETMALLPGSPAINAGASFGLSSDQRGLSGVTRNSTTGYDIGAFQSQGFTISIISGNNQSVPISSPFSNLTVHVTAIDTGLSDLSGGIITFSAPASGSSAVLDAGSSTPYIGIATLDSAGDASTAVSANSTPGSITGSSLDSFFEANRNDYNVTASTGASTSRDATTTFSLTNLNETLNLTATATTDGNINLRWVNDSPASSYTILRGTSSTSLTSIGTVSAATPDLTTNLASVFEDTPTAGLLSNTTYYYQVVASNSTTSWSYTYPTVVSATTATGGAYSSTPLQTVEFTTGDITTQTPIESENLTAGVHYEIVASGYVGSSGSADAEYASAPGSTYDPMGPTANATFDSGLSGWSGQDFVNFGIGINDSTLDQNKYPYWGTYNSSGTYAIDVVGTGGPLNLTYHDDYFPPDVVNGTNPLEVTIYQALPVSSTVSDLTATTVPAGSSATSGTPAIELQWAYVPPTSGSLEMEILRSTNDVTFLPIASTFVSGLISGNPVDSFLDDPSLLTDPSDSAYTISSDDTSLSSNQKYYYEVEISGVSGTTNIASATAAASEPYAAVAADTISVPVDGSTVSSHLVLQSGVHYKLVATGTTTLNLAGDSGTVSADAEYIFPTTGADSNGLSPVYVDYGIGIDDTSNSQTKYADWGWDSSSLDSTYSISNHTYSIDLVGQGQTLNFNYHSDLAPSSSAQDLEIQIFPEVPNAPDLTSVAADSANPQIDLAWTDATDDATGFIVERSTDDINFTPISAAISSTTSTTDGVTTTTWSCNDTTAALGTTYDYEILATGFGGNSAPSNTLSASITGTGSISGSAYNSVSTIDPPVGSGRVPITTNLTLSTYVAPTPTTAHPTQIDDFTNGITEYAPDNSMLADTITGSSPYTMTIYEIFPDGTQDIFAADTLPNPAATDSPPPDGGWSGSGNSEDSQLQFTSVPAGNLAGFTEGDVILENGAAGQIVRLTDDGKDYVTESADGVNVDTALPISGTIPAWVTLPTDQKIIGELFLDNSGPFGGDLVVTDAGDNIFLIDAKGNYTKVSYAVGTAPTSELNYTEFAGSQMVVVPDDTDRWGPLAGTILVFPENTGAGEVGDPPTSAYSVYDLSLSSSDAGSPDSPQLSVMRYGLNFDPSDGTDINGTTDHRELEDASQVTIIPTNADLYVIDHDNESEADVKETLLQAAASQFSGIAGDILLDQGSGEEHLVDVYWGTPSGTSTPQLYAKNIPTTSGFADQFADDAAFGPQIQTNSSGIAPGSALVTTPAAGREIYLDLNGNGQWDPGEPITTTAADGSYSFSNLAPGTYQVGEILPAGVTQVSPIQSGLLQTNPPPTATALIPANLSQATYMVTIPSGQPVTGINFETEAGVSDLPPVFTSTPTNTAIIGDLYQYPITVVDPNPGHSYTLDLPEHPAGMYIDYSSGHPVLTWTPTATGDFGQVLIRATDSDGAVAIQPITIYLSTATAITGLAAYVDGTSSSTDSDIVELSWNAYVNEVQPGATPVNYYLERSTECNFGDVSPTMGPDWIPMTPVNGFDVVQQNGVVYAIDNFYEAYQVPSGSTPPQFTPDTHYYYRVVAGYGGDGTNVLYTSATPTPVESTSKQNIPSMATTPAAPGGLTAVSSGTSIKLEWFADINSPTTKFAIYRNTSQSMTGAVEIVDSTSASSFAAGGDRSPDGSYTWSWNDNSTTDSANPPQDGQVYYYYVVAETSADSPSEPSNYASPAPLVSADAPTISGASWAWVPDSNYTQITITPSASAPAGGAISYSWSLESALSGSTPTTPDISGNPALPLGSTGSSVTGNTLTLQFGAAGTGANAYLINLYAQNSDGPCLPVTLTINIPQVASSVSHDISIAPSSMQLANGATDLFSATVYDQFGTAIPASDLSSVDWSLSSSSSVTSNSNGSITSGGLYTASAAGSNSVFASAETAEVTGTPIPETAVPATPTTQEIVPVTSADTPASTLSFSSSTAASISALTTSLPAPASLTANPLAQTKVQLIWATVANAAGYVITRRNPDSNDPVTVFVPSSLVTSGGDEEFIDTNLTPDSEYTYTVQAVDNSTGTHSGGVANALSPASVSKSVTTYAIPAAPTNVVATTLSDSEIQITWTPDAANQNVIGYQVTAFYPEGDGSFSPPMLINSYASPLTDPTVDVTNLPADLTEDFEVFALTAPDSADESLPSSLVTGSTSNPFAPVNPTPAGPASLSATYAGEDTTSGDADYGTQRIDLSWTAPSTGSIPQEYDIYALNDNSSDDNLFDSGFSLIATTNGLTYNYVDNIVPPTDSTSTTYYTYRVIAIVNGVDSNPSQPASVTISPTTTTPSPTAVSLLTTSSIASDHVTLTWIDPTSSSNFDLVVERASSSTGAYSPLATLDPTATSFTDYTVNPSSTYYYEIESINYNGGSEQTVTSTPPASAAVPGINSSDAPLTPGTPSLTNPILLPALPYDVSISWGASSDSDLPAGYTLGYLIYRTTSTAGPYTLLNSAPQTSTNYVDSTAQPSTSYYYYVRAINYSGTTGYVSNLSAASDPPISVPAANEPVVSLSPVAGPDGGVAESAVPILTSTTEIDGVASDGGAGLTGWKLLLEPFQPVGSTTSLQNITVAGGSNSIGTYSGTDGANSKAGLVTEFDPSLYPAGTYQLVLTATFEESSSSFNSSAEITIPNHAQIGNFTLPVTDMTVNVPGESPIVISRTYDSTKANDLESFGYGWQLDAMGSLVQTTESPSGVGSLNAMRYGDLVTITLPDGEQHEFQFIPTFDDVASASYPGLGGDDPLGELYDGAVYIPQFVCVDGSNAKLSVSMVYGPGAGIYTGQPITLSYNSDYFTDGNLGMPYDPADPEFGEAYTVTTSDGTSYTFNASSGAIEDSVDPNGNRTTYSGNSSGGMDIDKGGVQVEINMGTASIGGGDATVPVISSITVPGDNSSSGTESIYYYYDNYGNLIGVHQPQTPGGASADTYNYIYQDLSLPIPIAASEHYLIQVTNALNNSVFSVGYDPNTDIFDQITNAAGQTSTIATSGNPTTVNITGTTQTAGTSQTLTNADSDSTQDFYDAEGDVIRQIQTLYNSSNEVTGYLVTAYSYQYQSSMNLEYAIENGVSDENQLLQQTTYVPFEISGTDSAGDRFTEQPTQIQSQSTYFNTYDDADTTTTNDIGNLSSSSVLGANGALETTNYADYNAFGQPGTIVDPQQNVTTNTYNPTNGDLIETEEVDKNNNLLSETTYTYTDGTDGVAAGQVITTNSLNSQGQLVQQSYNTYYGNIAVANPAYPYIVPIPSGSADEAGELASSMDVNGVTHTYQYDAQGNQISDSYVWVNPADPYVPADDQIVTTKTTYDAANRLVQTDSNLITNASGATTLQLPDDTTTNYNLIGQVASTTDEYGNSTYNYYDINGNLIETLYPDGTETITAYDSLNRPVLTMDKFAPGDLPSSGPSGVDGTATIYNSLGQVIGTERVSNVDISVSINSTTQIATTTIVSAGTALSSTATTYNPDGTVASTTATDGTIGSTPDASTLTTAYTYEPNGQQATVTQENVAAALGSNATTPQNVLTTITLPSAYILTNSTTSLPAFSSTLTWDGTAAYVSLGMTELTAENSSSTVAGAALFDPSAGVALGGNGTNWVLVTNDGSGHRDVLSFTLNTSGPNIGLFSYASPEISGSDFSTTTNPSIGFNLTITYIYNNFGEQIGIMDPTGNTTSTGYDALGQVTSTGSALISVDGSSTLTSTTTYESYDDAGNKSSETNELGQTTTYKYDNAGNLIEVDQPQVSLSGTMTTPITKYTYDNYGNELSQTDAKGNVTSYTYDALGEELSETLPDSTTSDPQTETFTYDQYGRPLVDFDFDHNATAYVYDNSATGDGRVTGEYFFLPGNEPEDSSNNIRTTAADSSTVYTYNNLGQQASVTDSASSSSGFTADGETTYPTYDANGNVTQEVTPEGTINYLYNPLNELEETYTSDTQTYYTYDNLGRLSSVIVTELNGNTVGGAAYAGLNSADQPTFSGSPLVTTYGYDANGNKVYESDPNGDVTTYTYNASNQLTGETVTNGSTTLYTVGYTLNADGTRATASETQLQSAAGPTELIASNWGYDSPDRLTSESVSTVDLPTTLTLNSSYDINSSFSTTLTWDGVGAFASSGVTETTAGTAKGAVLFDPAAGLAWGGNGSDWVLVTYAEDSSSKFHEDVTAFTLSSGTFTFSSAISGTDFTSTHPTFSISLTAVSAQTYSNTYTYDLDGNQTEDVRTGTGDGTAGTTMYGYNGDNEMTSSTTDGTTTTYGYDNNGSQTTTTVGTTLTQTNTYNIRNQLQKVVNSNGTTTYVYDAAGDLVQETTGDSTTYYLTDDQNPTGYAKPIEVRVGSATGTPTTTYIIGDRVIAQATSSGTVTYLLVDGLDNTRAVVSASGHVNSVINYDALGNVLGTTYSLSNLPPTDFLFQQTMFDVQSGLNIFGDGVREEQVGMDNFIEMDSPGYSSNNSPITLNSYLLDDADAINGFDPSGHKATRVIAILAQQKGKPSTRPLAQSTAANPICFDASGKCVLQVHIGTYQEGPFVHTFISIEDPNGNRIGTISGSPSQHAGLAGFLIPWDSFGQLIYKPDNDMTSPMATIPINLTGTDVYDFIIAADKEADTISNYGWDYHSYGPNSNTLAYRAMQVGGGDAPFPFNAIGNTWKGQAPPANLNQPVFIFPGIAQAIDPAEVESV